MYFWLLCGALLPLTLAPLRQTAAGSELQPVSIQVFCCKQVCRKGDW